MAVGKDKARNVQHACQLIRNAAKKGANMVVLPVRYHITIVYVKVPGVYKPNFLYLQGVSVLIEPPCKTIIIRRGTN